MSLRAIWCRWTGRPAAPAPSQPWAQVPRATKLEALGAVRALPDADGLYVQAASRAQNLWLLNTLARELTIGVVLTDGLSDEDNIVLDTIVRENARREQAARHWINRL